MSRVPDSTVSMSQAYHAALQGDNQREGLNAVRAKVSMKEMNMIPYTRTANNELQSLFPTLKNPLLTMYIYPHLSGEGVPVPGYTTSFYMFDQNHFALPGEAAQE